MLGAAPTLALDAFSESVPGSAERGLSLVQVDSAWPSSEYKLAEIEVIGSLTGSHCPPYSPAHASPSHLLWISVLSFSLC